MTWPVRAADTTALQKDQTAGRSNNAPNPIAAFAYGRNLDSGSSLMPPNARGKPRRSAKHGGHPQAELVGVGLTNLLGWCAKWKRVDAEA